MWKCKGKITKYKRIILNTIYFHIYLLIYVFYTYTQDSCVQLTILDLQVGPNLGPIDLLLCL